MRLQASGFFDLQVNGFAGVDFNDPAATAEDIARALDALQLTGVTRCLPTLITSSFEDFARCARAALATGHAAVAGLHMEGPYLSPEDGPRGAHPREHVRPASLDDFSRRQAAAAGRMPPSPRTSATAAPRPCHGTRTSCGRNWPRTACGRA